MHDCIDTPEKVIRKLVVPLVGILGIAFEEVHEVSSDPALLGVYLSLIGLGATPWLRYFSGRRPHNEDSDGR